MKVFKFFDEASAAVPMNSKKAPDKLPDRLANRYFALAKDNALRMGAGLSIEYFRRWQTEWALKPNCYRFLAPNPLASDGEPPYRSCVADTMTGVAAYEEKMKRLPDGQDFRPCLHLAQDEGSIGLPCTWWELVKANIRGSFTEDEWHRISNDLGSSSRSAGIYTLMLEWTWVANFRAGPWKGASFLHMLKDECGRFFEDSSDTDPLFEMLYDKISHDMERDGDVDFGSSEHKVRIFAACASRRVWQSQEAERENGKVDIMAPRDGGAATCPIPLAFGP